MKGELALSLDYVIMGQLIPAMNSREDIENMSVNLTK